MGQTTNNVNDIFQNYLAQFLNKQFKIVNLSGENVINNKFDELFEIDDNINFQNKVIESMTVQWFEEHNDKRIQIFLKIITNQADVYRWLKLILNLYFSLQVLRT